MEHDERSEYLRIIRSYEKVVTAAKEVVTRGDEGVLWQVWIEKIEGLRTALKAHERLMTKKEQSV